jgi:carboxypeptidase PM20D1
MNAMLRTTTAVTVFRSGGKDNVLPKRATTTINFRILPGDTVESVRQHVQKTIANDRIKISLHSGKNEH